MMNVEIDQTLSQWKKTLKLLKYKGNQMRIILTETKILLIKKKMMVNYKEGNGFLIQFRNILMSLLKRVKKMKMMRKRKKKEMKVVLKVTTQVLKMKYLKSL